MAIDKINGTAYTAIDAFSGVATSAIDNISGIDVPSSGGSDIVFSDVTYSSFDGTIGASNPFNVTLPSSATLGDFAMVLYTVDFPFNGNFTPTPSGWTLQQHLGNGDSDNHLHVFTRILDGTEGSTLPITASFTMSGRGGMAWAMVCKNIDTTNPVGTNSTITVRSGSSMTVPAATSASAGTFICYVGFDGADGDPITMSNNGGFTFTLGGSADVPVGGRSTHVTSEWRFATIGASTSTGSTDVTFQKSDGKAGMHLMLQRA
jgi:hypothetical protein